MTNKTFSKTAFITAQTPFGKGETFILDELTEIKRKNQNIVIIPRNPPKTIFHQAGRVLSKNTIKTSVINLKMLFGIFPFLVKSIALPKHGEIIKKIFTQSNSAKKLLKNLAILPKGILLSKIVKEQNVKHIHAHWGSTTATMAYVASKLTNIPWSMTLHRWDIKENNILKEKVKTCKFVRCISNNGKKELLTILKDKFKNNIHVIHMGTKIPNKQKKSRNYSELFTIITPANLLPVKGHKYLIEACEIMIKQNIKNIRFIFYGDGPGKQILGKDIKNRNLQKYIQMPGVINHKRLIDIYKNKKANLVVIPSINTQNNEHEGIPVALIEAMAHKIPVISTKTGGIPELLINRETLVKEKSSIILAKAIIEIIKNNNLKETIVKTNFQKVNNDFNVNKVTNELLELIE